MKHSERLMEEARRKNREALELWQQGQDADAAESAAQQAPSALPAPPPPTTGAQVEAYVAAEIAYSRSIGLPVVPDGYTGFGLFQLPTSAPAADLLGAEQASMTGPSGTGAPVATVLREQQDMFLR
jgi:hypothetical protein